MHSSPISALLLCIALLPCLAQARDAGAPPTPAETVTDEYHHIRVDDPYRWLEDGTENRVQQWAAAQTARTQSYLDRLVFYPALRAQVEKYVRQTSARYFGLRGVGRQVFASLLDPARQQPSIVVMGDDLDPAGARTVFDPGVLDPTGGTLFDWFVPSPDGRLLAVSLSTGGSESGTLHVLEVRDGTLRSERIPRVHKATAGGDLAWSADGGGFWYTRYPGEERPQTERDFFQQVYYHRLGTDPQQDSRVFGDGLPKVAEIQLQFSAATGKLLLSVQNGDGGEFAHFVLAEDRVITQVTRFEDGIDYASFGPDGALYLVSERNTPRRAVLKLEPGILDIARASVIVPEGEDVIPIDFFGEDPLFFAGGRMFVRYLAGGPSRVRVFGLDGKAAGEVDLPPVASVDELEPIGTRLAYSVETYLTPGAFHLWSDGRSQPTALKVTSPVDFGDMEVVREFATSRDGTRIPVNIIRRKHLEQDGSHPLLLYAYGGYGVSETPFFLGGPRRIWFDAGGVFAIANIRGGGEFGENWHRQGALTHKQNCFDDFVAAAEMLVAARYTSPGRLAIRGSSNGGLLMGAVTTQRPELFRAVVAEVGMFDMLRSEFDPNGEFNIPEFGSVKNPQQFQALHAYSPYHHVRPGSAYPAIFLSTGENDGRVNPMHSRKMAARLQAATESGKPVFLITISAAGHGVGNPLGVQIRQTANYLAFLLDQLDMRWPHS